MAACLTDLPLELIEQVALRLPRADIPSFALTCSDGRAACAHLLRRHKLRLGEYVRWALKDTKELPTRAQLGLPPENMPVHPAMNCRIIGHNAGASLTSGQNHIVLGCNADVLDPSERDVVIGYCTKARGSDNTVFGTCSAVVGSNNLVYGNNNVVLGDHNIVFAYNVTVVGSHNVVLGRPGAAVTGDWQVLGSALPCRTPVKDLEQLGALLKAADRQNMAELQTFLQNMLSRFPL